MFIHRCVGKVNFLACDMVLGAEGTTGQVENLLRRVEPDTLVLDRSVDDLDNLDTGKLEDPFLEGLTGALEEVAHEPVLRPYARALAWAENHGAQLKPIGPRARLGWIQNRRVRKLMQEYTTEEPERRANAAVQGVLQDERVGELAQRHRRNLADSLENVLNQEPPRTVVLFAHPWGEMVSADVRRSMGLRRVEGEALSGGWPA